MLKGWWSITDKTTDKEEEESEEGSSGLIDIFNKGV